MPVPMVEYLRKHYREPQPEWLDLAESASDPEVRRALIQGFLQSRIVYYPASGEDGHPVKLFNQAHAAHAYVYADLWYTREQVQRSVTPHPASRRRGFRGYRILTRLDLRPEEVAPWPPRYHVCPGEAPDQSRLLRRIEPFALLYIFERLPEFGDDHGARRFAVLFLCADDFAAYDALFCQPGSIARPFCVLVQDYSMFVIYQRFDRYGLLERIAYRTKVWPELLLVAYQISEPWHGYVEPDLAGETLEPEMGGMNGRLRKLYVKAPDGTTAASSRAGRLQPPPPDPLAWAMNWRIGGGL